MSAYYITLVIDERDDCEPFRTKKDVSRFVEGKLRDGTVVDPRVISVRDKDMSDGAIELALYAQNDSDAYRTWILPILQACQKDYDQEEGDYKRVLALFRQVLLLVAKQYVVRHGDIGDSVRSLFPPSVRKEAAEYLAADFITQYRAKGGRW